MVLGQLDIHKQKSEAEHPLHVIYKKKKKKLRRKHRTKSS